MDKKIKVELTLEDIQLNVLGLHSSEIKAIEATRLTRIYATAVKNHEEMQKILADKKGKKKK